MIFDMRDYANKLLRDMAAAQKSPSPPKPVRKDRCPQCDGLGRDDRNDRCWYCHGAGWIEYEVKSC